MLHFLIVKLSFLSLFGFSAVVLGETAMMNIEHDADELDVNDDAVDEI